MVVEIFDVAYARERATEMHMQRRRAVRRERQPARIAQPVRRDEAADTSAARGVGL
jgi:hypothetical protein